MQLHLRSMGVCLVLLSGLWACSGSDANTEDGTEPIYEPTTEEAHPSKGKADSTESQTIDSQDSSGYITSANGKVVQVESCDYSLEANGDGSYRLTMNMYGAPESGDDPGVKRPIASQDLAFDDEDLAAWKAVAGAFGGVYRETTTYDVWYSFDEGMKLNGYYFASRPKFWSGVVEHEFGCYFEQSASDFGEFVNNVYHE